jgi:hypothetical protein
MVSRFTARHPAAMKSQFGANSQYGVTGADALIVG